MIEEPCGNIPNGCEWSQIKERKEYNRDSKICFASINYQTTSFHNSNRKEEGYVLLRSNQITTRFGKCLYGRRRRRCKKNPILPLILFATSPPYLPILLKKKKLCNLSCFAHNEVYLSKLNFLVYVYLDVSCLTVSYQLIIYYQGV